MSERPSLTRNDIYRIIHQFLAKGSGGVSADEITQWCERRDVDEEAMEALAHSIETSATVMFTRTIVLRAIDEGLDPDDVIDPQAIDQAVHMATSVGLTFFMLGFEVAREVPGQ